MDGIGTAFIAVLAIAFLVISIIAASKESKVTGTYRAFGVYGRIKAYLFVDFSLAGIVLPVTNIISAISGEGKFEFMNLILGIVLLGLAFLIYKSTAKKCPDFLKKNLLKSLFISGFGVALKICIFFIAVVWKITGPKEMVDENGRELLMYDGKVYTANGEYVGEASDDRKSYIEVEK